MASALRTAALTGSRSSAAPVARIAKRGVSQLQVQPNTGRVHVQQGPGGRHSSTGHVATVFGCTGFLGRYVVSKLAKAGTQVIVPYRDADEARHLRVTGDLGQIVPMEWDLNNDTQIDECLRHSDTVYNLVGRDYITKNYDFTDVNVVGARRIARIAKQAGVSKLIHVSHMNADPNSKSSFYRTKFEGEQAVREAFPESTIVKPSWMYGYEDRLLNTLAVSPSVFRVNHGDTRIRPVHSLNVAEALHKMMTAKSAFGSTYVLDGPKEYTFEQLLHLVEVMTLNKLSGPNFPRPLLAALSRVWDWVWWPTLSPDEVTRRFIDDAPRPTDPSIKGFADLGIEPDVLEDVAILYLRRYRSAAYFDLPVQSGGIKLKRPNYHVQD